MPTSIHYYHFDGLGSVIALTNSAGSVVNLYEYSVYGEVSASDANHPNRFLFTGREFDKDTGLYYYRARYYNPYIGRFLQTDPIGYGDGMNPYAYCGNTPINGVDPRGLKVMWNGSEHHWYRVGNWPNSRAYDPYLGVSNINTDAYFWQHSPKKVFEKSIHSSMGILPMSHRAILTLPSIGFLHGRDARDTHGQDARATFQTPSEAWRLRYGDWSRLVRRLLAPRTG